MIKKLLLVSILVVFCAIASCTNSQFSLIKGHWEGYLENNGKVLNLSIDISEQKSTFDIPELGFYSQPFNDVNFSGDDINLIVSDDIVVSGILSGSEISAGLSTDESIKVSLSRKSKTPVIFSEEEVVYKSGDVKLSGSLIFPDKSGPHPVVVFIHGSGKMTRETMHNRACLFVKNGFSALIYDRRGRGKSEGDNDNILPMNVMANDVLAWVEYLKSRDDIKKDQIGLYGLSQGGWVAPLAATMSNDIAFLITISAPGISPDEQNSFAVGNMLKNQLAGILTRSRVPEDNIENILENITARRKEYDINSNAADKEIVPGFSSFEPEPVWEKISIPVLAIWGEKDELVPAQESRDIIKGALQKNGNNSIELKIFENADHTIKLSGNANKFAGKWRLTFPGSNELMVNWLKEQIKN
jgi:pimeloyl-ACP methyl ester carboxylesterase